MTPAVCGALHETFDGGRPVTLACSANTGHPGDHQNYYRDRLHEWPNRKD